MLKRKSKPLCILCYLCKSLATIALINTEEKRVQIQVETKPGSTTTTARG